MGALGASRNIDCGGVRTAQGVVSIDARHHRGALLLGEQT